MTNNSKTNNIIKGAIILMDFIVLNILLVIAVNYWLTTWSPYKLRTMLLLSNLAMVISEFYFSTIVHQRVVSAGDILKRLLLLTLGQSFFAYFFMKSLALNFIGGRFQLLFWSIFFVVMAIVRFVERKIIQYYRQKGRNTRKVTFVGKDSELLAVYNRLNDFASRGYDVTGYYADSEMENVPEGIVLKRLGTLQEFMKAIQSPQKTDFGDEIYVSISRKDRNTIRKISYYCDQNVVRFYYVPVSVETLGIDLKRELLDDIEIFTTYENPLMNPVNKLVKRAFDVVMSFAFLLFTLPFWPIVWLLIKIQSPGPLFFRQSRTGLDGKEFVMYKFRSMHVNENADKIQATKDDPRKFPFGDFMRKANIDEFPQFLNVLKGDMSIVGPRPHMLAHTEQYSQLIDKYMVRHFVKPGVTGWAQVTGFRGETQELWQMEGRVRRDIWYMEHWSIWLDIRIIWMTVKTIFVHDEKAY